MNIYRPLTEDELPLILAEGEGYKVEFKESINTDLGKELVAFANASGGRIFIGVDDRGTIVGCDRSNAALSHIQDVAASCDPPVFVEIEKPSFQPILVIHVSEGMNRPHRCQKGFYLRNGASSQKMSTADIGAYLQAEGRMLFDEQLRPELAWEEELDPKRLETYLSLSRLSKKDDLPSLLYNLGAGDFRNGRFYLNNAGVLFFSKQPAARFIHTGVVCGLYKGRDKAVILDRKEFTGSLTENVDAALVFLKQHLKLRFEITGAQAMRKEIPELPEVALREAIINAVTHRDYFEKGAQVMVEVFDDRVEISNPGGLPKALPPEQFGKRSVCRNPYIALLMYRCDYIEKMGSGIERIRNALAQAGCRPAAINHEGYFIITFPRVSPPHETPHETPHASPHVQKLLTLFRAGEELSRPEMMERLALKDRKSFMETYIQPALEEGFLEMTLPDKPKSVLQKYRLARKPQETL